MINAYRAEIRQAAAAHGLDARVVEAIVMVESAGKTHAYRYESGFWAKYLANHPDYRGANPERVSASYGLMQVMYPVAREMGFLFADPELLFVPATGLEYGCRKLASLLTWSDGDLPQALAAYNGGKAKNVTPPLRNQAYADRVLLALSQVPPL